MNKKIIAVLAVIFCMAIMATSVFAGNYDYEFDMALVASEEEVAVGDIFYVDIEISENTGFDGVKFYVEWDEGLILVDIEGNDDTFPGGFTFSPSLDKNPQAVVYAQAAETFEEDTFVTLTFAVDEDCEAGTKYIWAEETKDGFDITRTKVEVYIPEHVHTWDDGVVTTEPTCTAAGVKTFTCTDCGETKTEEIAKLDHTSDEGTVTTEPTCTEKGVKTFKCTVCGEVLKTEEIAANGHKLDDGTVVNAATCVAAGKKEYKCTVCGLVINAEEIGATGAHQYGDWAKKDDDTHAQKCAVCGYEKTEAHKWDDGKVVVEADDDNDEITEFTCTVCGATKQEVSAPHTFDVATVAVIVAAVAVVALAGVVLTKKKVED